jgi:hypothetical protein
MRFLHSSLKFITHDLLISLINCFNITYNKSKLQIYKPMDTQAREEHHPITRETLNTDRFDFDQWSIAVRRQLLASLQKRTRR